MELIIERVGTGSYIVRDEHGDRYVTCILREREARVLAEAERAMELLEDIVAWNDPDNEHRARALPPSLHARAVTIVEAAKVREMHVIGVGGR